MRRPRAANQRPGVATGIPPPTTSNCEPSERAVFRTARFSFVP